jgi:hypothetical protein
MRFAKRRCGCNSQLTTSDKKGERRCGCKDGDDFGEHEEGVFQSASLQEQHTFAAAAAAAAAAVIALQL